MNTKAIITVIVLIVIAVGAYMFWGGGMMTPGQNATSTPQGQTSNGSSLSSLVASGQAVTCTFSTTTAAGSTSGTIYVAGGMVAGDFFTNTSSQSVESHMIVRDGTNYVWTNLSNQGFKSSVNATTTSNNGVDYNAQMNYSCQPWVATGTHFNLPTNISFVTTASFTPPSQGAGATGAGSGTKGTAEQCAACNSLSGAQKAQCIAALQC